jgi:hypothetical protein
MNDRLVVTLFGHTHDLCCVDDCQTVEMRIQMKDSKGGGGEMTLILVKPGEYSDEESTASNHSSLKGLEESEDSYDPHFAGALLYKNKRSHD